MRKTLDAKEFIGVVDLGGIQLALRCRVFIDGDKIVGVRSVHLLNPDGSRINTYDMGTVEFEETAG